MKKEVRYIQSVEQSREQVLLAEGLNKDNVDKEKFLRERAQLIVKERTKHWKELEAKDKLIQNERNKQEQLLQGVVNELNREINKQQELQREKDEFQKEKDEFQKERAVHQQELAEKDQLLQELMRKLSAQDELLKAKEDIIETGKANYERTLTEIQKERERFEDELEKKDQTVVIEIQGKQVDNAVQEEYEIIQNDEEVERNLQKRREKEEIDRKLAEYLAVLDYEKESEDYQANGGRLHTAQEFRLYATLLRKKLDLERSLSATKPTDDTKMDRQSKVWHA